MATWVPSPDFHREIAAILRAAKAETPRLSLAEYKALPEAQRVAQYYATWNPLRGSAPYQRAWCCLLELLANGEWAPFSEMQDQMVQAGPLPGIRAPMRAYDLLRQGVRAGALEEHRILGSYRLRRRLIRMRWDCPERLLPPSLR